MEETKIYKKNQIFEDVSNCKAVRPGVSASAVLAKFLQAPSVIMHQQQHSLVNFNVEELVELPIPHKNRFWVENLSDGKYVVIDKQCKRALSNEFGRFFESGYLTDFKGVNPPPLRDKFRLPHGCASLAEQIPTCHRGNID